MSVTGSDIQCSILDKTHTALSTVSATDDDFVSGGISFMPFDVSVVGLVCLSP